MSLPSTSLFSPIATAARRPIASAIVDSAPSNEAKHAIETSRPTVALNLLAYTTTGDDARKIQQHLAPDEAVADKDQATGRQADQNDDHAVLTFARSLSGTQFCLSDRDRQPPFDALLWPVDDTDPNASLSESAPPMLGIAVAAGIPLIVITHDDIPESFKKQCQEHGLRQLISWSDLKTANLKAGLGKVPTANTSATNGGSDSIAAFRKMARGIAHEVRNPLSCIQMCLDLMRQKLQTGTAIDADALERISSSVQRAEEFLASVSDLAQTPTERSQQDLCECARRAIETCRDEAIRRGVKITLDCLVETLPVNIHPSRVRQVFVELIDNAIHACPEGGEVLVRLGTYNGQARAVVIDNGPGLPKIETANPQAWFQPFFAQKIDAGPDGQKDTGSGVGIGLARVANTVDLHNGQVKLVNRTDRNGAVADLRLPLPGTI